MPQKNQRRGELEHPEKVSGVTFISDDQAPEVLQSGKQPLDFPPSSVSLQPTSILSRIPSVPAMLDSRTTDWRRRSKSPALSSARQVRSLYYGAPSPPPPVHSDIFILPPRETKSCCYNSLSSKRAGLELHPAERRALLTPQSRPMGTFYRKSSY